MGAPLALRPISSRLTAAYLFTALRLSQGFYPPEMEVQSSFERLADSDSSYRKLWKAIQEFAYLEGWNSLSDEDISQKLTLAKNNDFTLKSGITIKPEHVIEAQMLWNKRGWVSYEKQRAGKGRAVRQFGLPAVYLVGACFGVALPMD